MVDGEFVTKLTVEQVRAELERIKAASEDALRRLDQLAEAQKARTRRVSASSTTGVSWTPPQLEGPVSFPMGYSAPSARCSTCGRPSTGTYYPQFGAPQVYCDEHAPTWGVVEPEANRPEKKSGWWRRW